MLINEVPILGGKAGIFLDDASLDYRLIPGHPVLYRETISQKKIAAIQQQKIK